MFVLVLRMSSGLSAVQWTCSVSDVLEAEDAAFADVVVSCAYVISSVLHDVFWLFFGTEVTHWSITDILFPYYIFISFVFACRFTSSRL